MARSRKSKSSTKDNVKNPKVSLKWKLPEKGKVSQVKNHQQLNRYSLRHGEAIGADAVEKLSISIQPVVMLSRCNITEDLLHNLYHTGDKMVSDMERSSISTVNPNMSKVTRENNQASTSDRLKFIQSFKITTDVNNSTPRRIDLISLPVETVSTKSAKPKIRTKKAVQRKLPWRVHNNLTKDIILKGIFNITSSNSIFNKASLDYDRPIAGMSSPRTVTLSRTISMSSVNTISNVKVWQSIEPTNVSANLTRSYESPAGVYDYPAKESRRVTSDSSGYYSEQKFSDSSPTSSVVSSPKRRSNGEDCFRESTSYKEKDTFAKLLMENNFDQRIVINNKRKCDFKTPHLPLFKRPPTRIKPYHIPTTSSSASISSSTINSIDYGGFDDDSDVISLFAESTCLLDNEDDPIEDIDDHEIPVDSRECVQVATNIKQRPNIKPSIMITPTNISNLTNKTLKPLPALKEVKIQLKPPIETVDTVRMDTSKIKDWIVSTSAPKCPINATSTLNSIKKLCHYHFRTRSCFREHCFYSHKLPDDFCNTLRELNEEQFQMVLEQICKFRYLFKDTFEILLMYYKENNLASDLIYLIEYILKLDFDKTPFIKAVITTLKDMGYSFVGAIDEILLTHGMKTQILLDILLLIIVEEDDCLENNWHFIDKITRFRKNKLDYGVVSDIFQKCCNAHNPNKEFCENIYKDLIIKSHTELDKLERSLVIKYINLLYHFDLVQYAEQLKQNNGIDDQELCIKNQKQPEAMVRNEVAQSSKSSQSDTSTDSSSSDSDSTTSTSESENIPPIISEGVKNDISVESDATDTEIAVNFSSDCIDPINVGDDEVESEKETEEKIKNSQEPPQNQLDVSLEPNQNYTNSDLDIYLDHVNREIYSGTNFYTPDECSNANKYCDVNGRVDVSSRSDRSQCYNPRTESSCSNTSPDESHTNSEMADSDIVNLISAVAQDNISDIFTIMKHCSDNNLSRNFVIHMITAVKKLHHVKAKNLIWSIFENLAGLLPHFQSQLSTMKQTMNLLAFNILPLLDERREYDIGARIINIFTKEMDTFTETECIPNSELLSTVRLRYLFLFKIFVRSRQLREALKLLKSPNADLLEDFCSDKESKHHHYKQRVLTEFLEVALQKDIQIAREAVLYLMLNMDSLQNFINLSKYLNQLVVKLLNLYRTYRIELLSLIDNILNGWFKHLKHSVMRAILIQGFYNFPERKLMDFFNLCVEVGIYGIHEGFKNSIEIPKNLLSEEIHLVIHIQFHKICKSDFPLHNIIISVGEALESDEYTDLIQLFTNSLAENGEMVNRILNVFTKRCPISNNVKIYSGVIEMPYEDLDKFFKSQRTNLSSIPPKVR